MQDSCDEFACQLDELGLFSPSLSGLKLRAHQYLAHLQQWERLAAQVIFTDDTEFNDGFFLLNAMAAAHLGAERLVQAYEEHGNSKLYDSEQEVFLESCERLRIAQGKVQNVGAIEEKFRLLVDDQVRTSSRIEALNRRVCSTGLHLIGKLRKDSKLRRLYRGSKKKGPGRPKLYDGDVDDENLEGFEKTHLKKAKLVLYSAEVYHPRFKRNIAVTIVKKQADPKGWRAVLYSTETSLSGQDIYEYYKARFQLEFVFRDGKQYMGFADCQMRDAEGIHMHLNTSLCALNLLRLEDRDAQKQEGQRVISLYSWKMRKYNERLINLVFRDLGFDESSEKMVEIRERFNEFGTIAA